jgi:hypothetical protein
MEVACFHIPQFPAWVRGRLAPRQDLIGVHAGERIIARSPALAALGLRIGERIDRARLLFRQAAFFQHDPHLDQAMWEDVLAALNTTTPNILPLQPGWACAEPWDREGLATVAGALRGSIGIASRRFAAMVAALKGEPGSVLEIPAPAELAFLDDTPVAILESFGFPPETVERLGLFGLVTLGRVRALSRRHLRGQFGPSGGELFDLLHPDESDLSIPLYQPPPSIEVGYHFERAGLEPAELLPVLRHLVCQGTAELGGLHAQRIRLRLDGEGGGMRTSSRVLNAPTSQPRRMLTAAETMLRGMLRRDAPVGVETMIVELSGLVQPPVVQQDLFTSRPELYEAVKQIHRRWPGVLFRAVVADPEAYIPEEGIRLEPYPDAPPPKPKRRRGR